MLLGGDSKLLALSSIPSNEGTVKPVLRGQHIKHSKWFESSSIRVCSLSSLG